MKYIIRRIESFGGIETLTYMTEDGFSKDKTQAKLFDSIEEAKSIIEVEKHNPEYDKPFTGRMKFRVLEAKQ